MGTKKGSSDHHFFLLLFPDFLQLLMGCTHIVLDIILPLLATDALWSCGIRGFSPQKFLTTFCGLSVAFFGEPPP